MDRREKILIGVVAILLVVMGIKSVAFDQMKATTPEEATLMTEMQAVIDRDEVGFLYDWHILSTRIVKVADEEGYLRGHYRKYVLGIFPFGDEYYNEKETN